MDTPFHRVKADSIGEIIRCEMGIRHCLFNGGMSQYPLQSDDIAAVNHEMSGERMTQYVQCLSFWQVGFYPAKDVAHARIVRLE